MNSTKFPLPSTARRVGTLTGALLLGTTVALVSASPALAHVGADPSTSEAGAHTVVQMSFSHGCDGQATSGLTIQIPEGVESITPTRKPGWQITVDETSVNYSTRDAVPDGEREVFELALKVPDAVGDTLYLPTIQHCGNTETAWVEIPAQGQDSDDVDLPAPAFTITAAGDEAGASESSATTSESSTAEQATNDTGQSTLTFIALGVSVVAAALAATALLLLRRRS